MYTELPTITDLTASATEPEQILERHLVKKANAAIPQVKIKWSALPEATATWEDYNVIKARFPSSLAWGQADIPGGEMSHPRLDEDGVLEERHIP